MRAAFFSKNGAEKTTFVESFLAQSGKRLAIHIYPKNRKKEQLKPAIDCDIYAVTYEDLTKKEQWLHVNSLLGKDTVLILENPSRYPKISSEKVTYLQKLAMQVEWKAIADIVPFTLSIEYLYTPYSYLGRELLGYAHYYAFRENYHELDEQGNVRSAHDFDVLAEKVKAVSAITYPRFLCSDWQLVECTATAAEQAGYTELRDRLFETESTPQVIVTKLADFVHAFESRLQVLLDLLSGLNGNTVVFTNLTDYAKRIDRAVKKAGFKNVTATSYQMGSDQPFDNAIYFESPIVKSYFLLDAESRLPDGCNVFHVRGDTKVDRYLYSKLIDEIDQIDRFTQELHRATHHQARPEAVPPDECLRSSTQAGQMDLFSLQAYSH